jgi:hypothetical protein
MLMHIGLHSHMLTAVYPSERASRTITQTSHGVHVTWNQAHKRSAMEPQYVCAFRAPATENLHIPPDSTVI